MGGPGSGGARSRSGPAPDPMALRRDRDGHDWLTLPAGGLQDVPEWPLTGKSDREAVLWADLWQTKPQAHEWKRLQLEHEVALYVRRFTEAEIPLSPAALSTLVRQMADSLGLTTAGLQRNKWRIAGGEAKPERPARQAKTRRASSARDRFRVVPPAADGS